MAFIIETPNAFEPLNAIKHLLEREMTIQQWVDEKYPTEKEFPVPTICLVNGEAKMRKDWGQKIQPTDIVNFIAVPAGIETIILVILVVLVVAFTLYTTLNQPKTPGEQAASDPVFSVKGQQNAIRLGEPIECPYGRNRIYPSYASRPYFEYRDNDQFQFSLFCIGQGVYDIEAIQIGDTPIANFQEVQWEVIPPGSPVTLFPAAVYSSPEAGGQTLFGYNEPEYTGEGWAGPFPANPPGTEATKLQIDVTFPKGIYRMTKKGKVEAITINFQAQTRLINDVGTPLGGWVEYSAEPLTITAATTTPQRRTYIEDVTAGRYEVRIRKVSGSYMTSNVGDELVWEALRSYISVEQDFGNVTLLAVIIRATNNLNEQTQQQFNVICTRKLPIRESAGFTDPIATRSIIWALVDVFQSVYGGRIFDDAFFDWDTLEELDDLYTERGEYFDWIFRDPITVWEAAKTVARVGRATPLLAGSLITLKRDGPLSIPVAMFNQENIVDGSFTWDVKLWDLDEYDSIKVEYTEPSTGYKQEQVTAVLPGGTTDHPQDVQFPGIQDRTHAYHEGLYLLASNFYLRENITFETGLEGFIPTYGDLIAVAHDTPKWGQGGYVVHAVRGVGDIYTLWVSVSLEWSVTDEHQVLLRGRRGQVIGPLTATQTTDPKQLIIHSTADIDFLLGGGNEPMLFLFGVAEEGMKLVRVVMIEPQGRETIRIKGVVDQPIIHSFDDLLPAPLATPALPPVPPDLPEIEEIRVVQIDAALQIVQISWTAAFGAKYYVVQTSEDGTNWRERAQTTRTSLQVQTFPGVLYARVAAVNTGQGPWISTSTTVHYLLSLNVTVPWSGLEWEIDWQAAVQATGYIVKVYDNTSSVPVLKRTITNTSRVFAYDYNLALTDSNLVRDMLVTVDPVFADEFGEDEVEQVMTNSIPLPPTSPASEISSVESDQVVYRLSWTVPEETDLVRIAVWLSPVNNFDPAVDIPTIDETSSAPGFALIPTEAFVSVALDSTGGHAIHYWRVAIFDVWGNEVASNVTAQQTIAAYA